MGNTDLQLPPLIRRAAISWHASRRLLIIANTLSVNYLQRGSRLNVAYFSTTYAEARRRFTEAATAIDAEVTSYVIDAESQDELAIDIAVIGAENDRTVVISSGVHGVEGFLGSAVQLALLDRLRQHSAQPRVRYVLIHSVNPFGFSQLRRFNEDNVDLNRNFHSHLADFTGAPDTYAGLNAFLNPPSPPSRFEPFQIKAMWHICRTGLPALKASIAGGQYEYPRGLFFGGSGPCKSTQVVMENCDAWIGPAQRIVHLDFHTGLGAFGTYKLLLTENAGGVRYDWYTDTFGTSCVEPLNVPGATAYPVSGMFGKWMQNHFRSRDYHFAAAEFGTYGALRVVAALRAENRVHHYGSRNSSLYQSAKNELLECFCPRTPSWRTRVVESGLRIIEQAAKAC